MLMTRAPARVVPPPSDDARVREAAATELGPQAAATMPAVKSASTGASATSAAEPVDPGAQALVKSIATSLSGGARPADDRGVTVITLRELHNYSRAGHGEFNHLLKRLATLLSRAGRDDKLEFIPEDTAGVAGGPAPHFRMQGAAYLITADGFDQWELFLSITPTDRDFGMWDSHGAVRVLRTARPGVPQIVSTDMAKEPGAP